MTTQEFVMALIIGIGCAYGVGLVMLITLLEVSI